MSGDEPGRPKVSVVQFVNLLFDDHSLLVEKEIQTNR